MALKKSGGPFVGLDIGSTTIKAVELECRGGKFNLRGLGTLPTPPEAVVNGEIVDPVALGRALKGMLQSSRIRARDVISSVSGQNSLVVRIIEVPRMTRAELQDSMKWEIERHVPFHAEQVVTDFQPLTPPEEVPEGQNMEVLLAVAQESLVLRHLEALQAAGLKPRAVDLETLAASRALLEAANGSSGTTTVALVDIGAASTDISIFREGRIVFTRSIQLAGNNLTKAIADVTHRPLAEAEALKKDMARVPEQTQAGAPPGDFFGGVSTLDFGLGEGEAPLGGTFGMGPDPGASTATDDASTSFDVAGSGITPEAFTEPSAEAPSLFGDAPAAGPVPAANPFDPDAGLLPAGGQTAGGAFDTGLFGPAPAANPFGGEEPGPFGGGGPAMPAPGALAEVPAAMSEEDVLRAQITDAIMPVLQELVTELRRSLDFYRNRANGLGAQQIVLTGGTARMPGLAEYLAANLETPVVVADPLQYLSLGPGVDRGYAKEVAPLFPVAVGLAARDLLYDPPKRGKR
jgi:type IV pilus assembly protein PilM